MPGALVAHEIDLGKMFTSKAAAMVCNLLTENSVVELLQSVL